MTITEALERQADTLGIRLEVVNGLPVWEPAPVIRHQRVTDRIRRSIRPTTGGDGCGCIHYADITILFPDGSMKRPDISIFCQEPTEDDTACRTIPDAVIEVLSKGYEKKDTEVSLPFYLEQGIADIIVIDPATGRVTHHRRGEIREYQSPAELTLQCGCLLTE
ncbi:MAG TPA: Uma2 family endonuclease [Chthonomonadaceae bacterium]|nr:Uma2 family endonuclease [Chthonomonadaceae bacterium]